MLNIHDVNLNRSEQVSHHMKHDRFKILVNLIIAYNLSFQRQHPMLIQAAIKSAHFKYMICK